MLGTLRNLYGAFAGLPMLVQAIITVAAILAGLVGLGIAVALSPLVAVLFLLAFLVCAAAFLYRLFRGRPAMWFALAGAASFVLMVAFSGVSAALYGGGGEETQPTRGVADTRPEPRGETTRAKMEAAAEKVTREETTAEPEPEVTTEEATQPAPEPSAQPEPEPQPETNRYDATVTVTRVVDGDTVEILPAVEGVNDVRLIGVDTPETKDPSEEVEPYGPEASAFALSELEGREVGIELDAEKTDGYGRLLAYVYLEGEMFNERLVEEGYAQTWFIAPNTRHEAPLTAAQETAKGAVAGIWGLPLAEQCLLANHGNGIGEGEPGCAEEQEPPPEPQYEPTPQYDSAPGGDVDCPELSSAAEAEAYLLPGDPHNLDADDDGIPCEDGTGGSSAAPAPQYGAPAAPPPAASSGYPDFPGDPYNGPTCDEVGGGPYSVPSGSPRDADGDGVACE